MVVNSRFDVLVIGAGFSGLCALHRLRQLGLRTRVPEYRRRCNEVAVRRIRRLPAGLGERHVIGDAQSGPHPRRGTRAGDGLTAYGRRPERIDRLAPASRRGVRQFGEVMLDELVLSGFSLMDRGLIAVRPLSACAAAAEELSGLGIDRVQKVTERFLRDVERVQSRTGE